MPRTTTIKLASHDDAQQSGSLDIAEARNFLLAISGQIASTGPSPVERTIVKALHPASSESDVVIALGYLRESPALLSQNQRTMLTSLTNDPD